MKNGKQKKGSKEKDSPVTPDKIRFDYLKSNQHREIFVEGVHGGVTPKARIQMSLFCDRNPIPRQIVHEFNGLELGPEIKSERLSRDAIIRSVEATLIMDLETAEVINNWLKDKIKECRKVREAFEKTRKK